MKDWKIIQLESCESTNGYAKELRKQGLLKQKTAILSDYQTKGRGQGVNSWFSDKSKNLLCSFSFQIQLPASEHFLLNVFTSISLTEVLEKHGIQASIKWPNDIYVEKKKIAGILIENSLLGSQITETIIGIGLNINQEIFPETIPNPVSMFQLKQKHFAVSNIFSELLEKIEENFSFGDSVREKSAFGEYLLKLYKLNEWCQYSSNNHIFEGRIIGVKPDGRLIIETVGGKLKLFEFGEISFLMC